jgi:hypothetical protein
MLEKLSELSRSKRFKTDWLSHYDAKWVLQGPTFVGYYYCTEGLDPQSSFCVRVTLPTTNPQIELQLDYLVQSITFY